MNIIVKVKMVYNTKVLISIKDPQRKKNLNNNPLLQLAT